MEFITTIGVIVTWFATVVMSRMVTTTIHELGHAVPSLLFTKEEVVMHVGSYGVEKGSRLLKMGRLKAFFRFNILHSNIGLCQHGRPASYYQQLLIILGGPVFSLLLGGSLLLAVLAFQFSDWVIGLLMIFILSAVWDFVVNMFPVSNPIQLQNGGFTYNDGRQLLETWREMRYPSSYFEGLKYAHQREFKQASHQFRQTIEQGFKDRQIYHQLIEALRAEGKIRPAIACYEEYAKQHKFKPEDYRLLGNLYAENGQSSKAIECFDQCLFYNFRNSQAYNERGLIYLKSGHTEKAIADFRMAVYHDVKYTPAYINLGNALVENGESKEGNQYLQTAKKMQ